MNIQPPLSQSLVKILSLFLNALDRLYDLLPQIGVFYALKLATGFGRILQELAHRLFRFSYSVYLIVHRYATGTISLPTSFRLRSCPSIMQRSTLFHNAIWENPCPFQDA
jgi:hypothetical protein